MLPWMREQIAEVRQSRKSSKVPPEKRSGSGSKDNNTDKSATSGNLDGSGGSEDTATSLPAAASSDTFSVNVISLEGRVVNISVKPSFTIERMKNIATSHFYGQPDTNMRQSVSGMTSSQRYRLVHPRQQRQLKDDRIIDDEEIKPSDELILMEVREDVKPKNQSEEELKGPNQETIDRLTADLPICNPPRPVPSTDCPADFQKDLRKILVTLVRASAKILTHSQDADRVYEILREKLELRCKPPSDPKIVRNLVDMGFSEKKVIKALQLRKMNTSEALEWLIEHQDDSDEEEIQFPSLKPLNTNSNDENGLPGPSSSSGAPSSGTRRRSLKEACKDLLNRGGIGETKKNVVPIDATDISTDSKSDEKKESNLMNVVALLLDSLRQYKKFDFKPNQRAKESLIEMGFEEKKVMEALRITGNDPSNACQWLLGSRRPSLQDFDDGLDPEGPVYKAIMENPRIQLSLNNPKMLLACLSILLETPSSSNVWINDPEVSRILRHIFRTYNSEKFAIHLNRYENNDS